MSSVGVKCLSKGMKRHSIGMKCLNKYEVSQYRDDVLSIGMKCLRSGMESLSISMKCLNVSMKYLSMRMTCLKISINCLGIVMKRLIFDPIRPLFFDPRNFHSSIFLKHPRPITFRPSSVITPNNRRILFLLVLIHFSVRQWLNKI
jgi:hypothetical protein